MLIMIPFVFLVNGVIKGDWLEAFIFAVSVAVGLTPEMLPMIVTANLAKGAVAMSKKKTIVKDLNAIQNFGAMNILCTDKTGTLTCDQIVLEKYINADGSNDESRRILRHAYFNSFFQTGLKNLMDKAILSHVKDLSLEYLKDNYTKVDEIPFDFTRRRMSVVVEDRQGKRQIITKGAVEEMLDICSHAEFDGEVHPMTIELKNKARDIIEQMNKQGMRVIAVAHKSYLDKTCDFRIEDEKDMVLIGYLAFLDPPKQSAASAIKQLHEHGIEIKILSGDNDAVVRTIARQVGIRTDNALTGPIFETMSEEEKMKAVNQTTVFSKLTPIQKTEIITLLQAQQHTVGFLGDGINDAAALRQSDIGISVDSAVDIAKESADIILLEKSLMVLEDGVLEGRKTFGNITKYIKMTASSNFGNMFSKESADIILLEKSLMVLEDGVLEGRKTFGNITKYIKMTASSNFGNMFSVMAASAFLPFLPMLPIHLLIQNLLYDISQTLIVHMIRTRKVPFIQSCASWQVTGLTLLIMAIGILLPFTPFGSSSQTLIVHMIRTRKVPFIQSCASWQVTGLTLLIMAIGILLPFTPFGSSIGLEALPLSYFPWLIGILLSYCILTQLIKNWYIHRFTKWL